MGVSNTPADWQPSVKYLLVLLVAEIFVFGALMGIANRRG
jgi:hypothetical protein